MQASDMLFSAKLARLQDTYPYGKANDDVRLGMGLADYSVVFMLLHYGP